MKVKGVGREPSPVDLGRYRRRRRGGSGRLRRALGWLLALAALGAIGWGGVVLRVERIRIVGLRSLSPDLVARVAALRGGERILFTRLDRVGDRVESLPAVRSTDVRRILPATVVIGVTERVPLAKLDTRPDLGVDDEGKVFALSTISPLPPLGAWGGRPEPGARLDPSTSVFLAAFSRFPEPLRIATAGLRGGADVALTLNDGTLVRFGRAELLEAKAAAAAAVLGDARARGVKLEYVDVRAPRTPVAGERATGKPTPRPA